MTELVFAAVRGVDRQCRLRDSRSVADSVDRLAALWTRVPTTDMRDEAAFREVYTDPVTLNGRDVAICELVERYRALHASFTDLDIEVLDRSELPGTLAVVLRQRGRHVGPLSTALGTVEPTGRVFDVIGIDVLTVRDERISRIWVVADDLGRLVQLEAVTLAAPAGDT
ncbi:MAG TPA: ester cyclase [Acidimicrobiales bacterium]|nr:ester cyclase [Acidimicrobiales bacterium]